MSRKNHVINVFFIYTRWPNNYLISVLYGFGNTFCDFSITRFVIIYPNTIVNAPLTDITVSTT